MIILKSPLTCLLLLFFCSTAYAADTSFLTSIYSLLLGGGPPDNANTLIVDKKGTGTGTISSDISGINCGTDCWEVYNINAIITLTAYSNSDSYFWGWSGGVCTGTAPCKIVMSQATTVEATFSANNASEETLLVVVSGQGVVTSTDISCSEAGGAGCQKSYPTDSTVTLTHEANGGTTFTGWKINGETSSTCPVADTCEVTMSESTTVTAIFSLPYPTETESNDSIELANDLTLGSEIGGVIEARGLSDYFKIEVNSARTVTAHLSSSFGSVSSDRRMVVQLQDNTGELITQFYVRPSTPNTLPDPYPNPYPVDYSGTPFNVYLPGAGTYYLVLMGTGYDYTSPTNPAFFDVEYKLTVDADNSSYPGQAEKEPNNEKAQADSLTYDTTIHGSLLAADDLDWFSTVGSTSGAHGATLLFNTPEPGRYWMITVYPGADGRGDSYPLARGAVKDGSKLYLPESSSGYYFFVSDFHPSNQSVDTYKGAPYTIQVTQNIDSAPVAELEDIYIFIDDSNDGQNNPVWKWKNNSEYPTVTLDVNSTHKSFAGQSQLVDEVNGHIAQDTDIFTITSTSLTDDTYTFSFSTDTDVSGTQWTITGLDLDGYNGAVTGDIIIPAGGTINVTVVCERDTTDTSISATYTITGTKQP